MSAAINAIEFEQRGPEWRAARCGMVTASRAGELAAGAPGKPEPAPRRNYRADLIVEILTGIPVDKYVTPEMRWGLQQEPNARTAYEIHQKVWVDTCGFVTHPEIQGFGASPDGLVGSDGIVQIKCPNTSTHLQAMLTEKVPFEHQPQILAELACTGRSWCDFVSFDPRLPAELQLLVIHVERDAERERLIRLLEAEVEHFNRELEGVLRELPADPATITAKLAARGNRK